MDKYFRALYNGKDKRSDVEANFSSTVMKTDTEAPWHIFVSTQIKSISDMWGKDCTYSAFLGYMGEVRVLQQHAYNHYTTYQAKYDQLSGQAKIAKLILHITN